MATTALLSMLLAVTLTACGSSGSGGPAKDDATPEPSVTPTPDPSPTARQIGPVHPVVDGNRLVDSRTGETWVPHGVNWSSFEYACAQGWGYSSLDEAGTGPQVATNIASWGADIVRLPINQDCWLGTRGAPTSDAAATTPRTAEGYRAAIREFVDQLHGQGIVVILDLQSRKRLQEAQFGNVAMPDADSLEFWRSVAADYASDPAIVFDAFNEPYSRYDNATNRYVFELSWSCWRDGGCQAPQEDDKSPVTGATYTVEGMAAVVAAIREMGAKQPIMLGGLDYSNDLSQLLAHLPDDDQLVASFHNYNFQRCNNTACWESEIAPVAARIPVLTGEVGENDHSTRHVEQYLNWAEDKGIGWLAWAWSPITSESMALTVDDLATPTTPYGVLVKARIQAAR